MMKKIILTGLIALSASAALAKNPRAHLGDWEDTCKGGGYYFHIETTKKTIATGSDWRPYYNAVVVDSVELGYVPAMVETWGPEMGGRSIFTPEERSQAQSACFSSLDNVAYNLESAADYNSDGAWGLADKTANSYRNPAKDLINEWQEATRKTFVGPAVKYQFNNGSMEYGIEVLEGRDLFKLPKWLKFETKDWKNTSLGARWREGIHKLYGMNG